MIIQPMVEVAAPATLQEGFKFRAIYEVSGWLQINDGELLCVFGDSPLSLVETLALTVVTR
jgi:hypothetical protein